MGLKYTVYINHFDPDRTRSKHQLDKFENNFCLPVQKRCREEQRIMAIAKLSALHVSAKNERKTKQNSNSKLF